MASGVLNVNKPRGLTSFAIVSLVRRLTGIRRVGHAGTLDPIADGVLPVCIGSATRVVEYLVSEPKAYRATIRFGAATDTYDSEGTVTATGNPSSVSRDELDAALRGFVGEIDQLAPMYSAVKFEGKPLYRYARAGKVIAREPRKVRVYRLDQLRFDAPDLEIELEVGRGAYVRTLAHDLGERVGCPAHLAALTRTRSGPFAIEDALTPGELHLAVEAGRWEEFLSPPDRVLESWQAALLAGQHTREVQQGRAVVLEPVAPASNLPPEAACRAYSAAGDFLAILRHIGGNVWHPERVFAPA